MKHSDNQQEVWNKIAESWADWRKNPSEETVKFSEGKKGKVLDIACGNCRQLTPFKHCELYGVDFSPEMIKNAREFCKANKMKVDLKVANASALPFDDNFFDAVLFLFSFHNLKAGDRKKSLKEMKRVMKPGAVGLLSVWLKKEKGDKDIPWEAGLDEVVYRYYYFFSKKELVEMVRKSGFTIEKSYISGKVRKNIFIELKKPI